MPTGTGITPGLQLPTSTPISRDWEGAAGRATQQAILGSPAPAPQSRRWRGGFGAERRKLNNLTGDIINLFPSLFFFWFVLSFYYQRAALFPRFLGSHLIVASCASLKSLPIWWWGQRRTQWADFPAKSGAFGDRRDKEVVKCGESSSWMALTLGRGHRAFVLALREEWQVALPKNWQKRQL